VSSARIRRCCAGVFGEKVGCLPGLWNADNADFAALDHLIDPSVFDMDVFGEFVVLIGLGEAHCDVLSR